MVMVFGPATITDPAPRAKPPRLPQTSDKSVPQTYRLLHCKRVLAEPAPRRDTGGMIRVLLVDDLPAVRHGLRLRLGLEADLTVVGEAADGQTALKLAGELLPDVIIMDLTMPSMDGLVAAGALRGLAPRSRVVMLTLRDDLRTRQRAAEAGAAALIAKYEPSERLIETIRQLSKCEEQTGQYHRGA